jgi:hypothetical protein
MYRFISGLTVIGRCWSVETSSCVVMDKTKQQQQQHDGQEELQLMYGKPDFDL